MPADYLHRAWNELAIIKQTSHVIGYIDAFKHICFKIPSISDDVMLDYFIHGL